MAEAAGQWGTALNTGLLGTVGLESHQVREESDLEIVAGLWGKLDSR